MKNSLLIFTLSLVVFPNFSFFIWLGFGLYLYCRFFCWFNSLEGYRFEEDDTITLKAVVFFFNPILVPIMGVISLFNEDCPNPIADIWRGAWKEIGYKVKFHNPVTFEKVETPPCTE